MALRTEARKPLYAFVGAGNLAVENIKDLPADLVAQATTFVPKTTSLVAEIPGKVTVITGKAFETYGDLVERGQKIVGSIRRSRPAQPAEAPVKVTGARAKKVG